MPGIMFSHYHPRGSAGTKENKPLLREEERLLIQHVAFMTCSVNHRCVKNHQSLLPAGQHIPCLFPLPITELPCYRSLEGNSMEIAKRNLRVARITTFCIFMIDRFRSYF